MADSIITNRRSLIKAFPFFGGAAILPAIALARPEMTSQERADLHWMQFCAALEEMIPTDCRLQIFGSHVHERDFPCFRIQLARAERKEVKPNIFIQVERSAGELYRGAYGWAMDTAI